MKNTMKPTVGILGAGHLGSAILAGLRRSAQKGTREPLVYDPQKPSDTASEQDLIAACEYIFLCVRPDTARTLLDGIQGDGKVILSAVAGLPSAEIAEKTQAHVLRIMPNLPCAYGEGAIAYASPNNLTAKELSAALDLIRRLGCAVGVSEDQFAAVTGLSGSGPAYVYMFLKALTDAGCTLGLSRAQSADLALQTVAGAAALVRHTPSADLAGMIEQVATPGGTTEAGVRVLTDRDFAQITEAAVAAAARRAEALQG